MKSQWGHEVSIFSSGFTWLDVLSVGTVFASSLGATAGAVFVTDATGSTVVALVVWTLGSDSTESSVTEGMASDPTFVVVAGVIAGTSRGFVASACDG